jgi:phosphoribosyl 1,2-cyclic phosphate phosphodiesterase
MPLIRVEVLGSGTSVGVPTVGCSCAVCTSSDPRNQRLRPSILIRYGEHNIVIDTTPDFRQQALRAGLKRLDAILFTHGHADHIMGLDDVRPFNFRQGAIPIYGSAETLAVIRRAFSYIFDCTEAESHVPKLELHELDGSSFELFGLTFTPIPLKHGRSRCFGFRFGRIAYLTDHSEIPPEAFPLLNDLEVLFLDALRYRPHPTHSTVEQSLEYARQINARRVFFTHISHDLDHQAAEGALPAHVRLAYDGLRVDVEEYAG